MSDVLPPPPPTAREEAAAGVATAIGCVLLGAPLGLLWAALAPEMRIVAADGRLDVVAGAQRDHMTTDVWFLGLVAAAGVLTAVVALLAARRHGIGTALGLALGGLLAAEVARRTGPLTSLEEARALLAGGQDGTADLPPRLRAVPAVVGWPVAALVVHLVGTSLRRS